MKQTIMKRLPILVVILVLGINALAQNKDTILTDISDMKDEDPISALTSKERPEATKTAIEIFKRGEKVIPLLMSMKNQRTISRPACLGDPVGAMGTLSPVDDATPEEINENIKKGYFVTLEVVSLYLISAIYYDNIFFAQVSYLTGNKYVKRQKYNTPARIKSAWNSTEKWYKKFKEKGMAELRKEKSFPLKSTKIRFYGTNPTMIRDFKDCLQ